MIKCIKPLVYSEISHKSAWGWTKYWQLNKKISPIIKCKEEPQWAFSVKTLEKKRTLKKGNLKENMVQNCVGPVIS